MKNHSKETKNVSKNDYYSAPEKHKDGVFITIYAAGSGMGGLLCR